MALSEVETEKLPHRDPEELQRQLTALERIALLSGFRLAADWIRDNAAHDSVWVETGTGTPEKMFAWVAKERGLIPIACAVCGRVATEVDSLHPYHQEWDRCAAHISG